MIVCVCRRVACTEIRSAGRSGSGSFEAFCERRQLGRQCGRCCDMARELFHNPHEDDPAAHRLPIDVHAVRLGPSA